MKKFAVAFFSNFSGELKLEIIEAESDLKAGAILVSGEDEKEKTLILEGCNTLKELQKEWLGNDFWVEVKEIV